MRDMDEDFNQLVMECNNCHLQFYAAELKTNAATNTLMCRNCLQAPGSRINVLKDRPLAQKKKEPTEDCSLILLMGFMMLQIR